MSVAYEVYGKVQGVFFRKTTRQQAIALGLVGWVKVSRVGARALALKTRPSSL